MKQSKLELEFCNLWLNLFPEIELEPEVSLIPNRKFRFDFVHYKSKTAVEINGKIWHKGGHSSGGGILRDYEKLNLAQLEGWRVFQLAGSMLNEYWLSAIGNYIKENSNG